MHATKAAPLLEIDLIYASSMAAQLNQSTMVRAQTQQNASVITSDETADGLFGAMHPAERRGMLCSFGAAGMIAQLCFRYWMMCWYVGQSADGWGVVVDWTFSRQHFDFSSRSRRRCFGWCDA
jgi:hypothetical protein